MSGPGAYIAIVLYMLPGFVVGSVIHELAHAAVAIRCGDPSPRLQHRLTLDPRHQLDPFGTAALLVAGFGWGRPMHAGTLHLRGGVQRAAVALAGPLAHLVVAAVFAVALRVEVIASGIDLGGFLVLSQFTAQGIVAGVLLQGFLVNVALFVFNALPLPGLDGYAALRSVLFTRRPQLFLWAEHYRLALYAAVVLAIVALPELTARAFAPLSAATIGLSGTLYAHLVEPGVTPLFLPLPNVFTLFA